MNCFGAKNETDSKKAIDLIVKEIEKLGYNVELKNFKIVNIAATCELNFEIKLSILNSTLSKSTSKNLVDNNNNKCLYDCTIFPGLIYHMNNPKITFIIFYGGKINFVGAKNRDEINDAFKKIHPLLLKHKQS